MISAVKVEQPHRPGGDDEPDGGDDAEGLEHQRPRQPLVDHEWRTEARAGVRRYAQSRIQQRAHWLK